MRYNLTVSSKQRFETIGITQKVKEVVAKSKIKEGLCHIYTMHATSAIIVNENDDPLMGEDLLDCLKNLIPKGKWKHDKEEDNTDAHIKASIIGPSQTIPISKGSLALGKWQNIMFCDFDGPRENRKIIVTIIEDK